MCLMAVLDWNQKLTLYTWILSYRSLNHPAAWLSWVTRLWVIVGLPRNLISMFPMSDSMRMTETVGHKGCCDTLVCWSPVPFVFCHKPGTSTGLRLGSGRCVNFGPNHQGFSPVRSGQFRPVRTTEPTILYFKKYTKYCTDRALVTKLWGAWGPEICLSDNQIGTWL